MEGLLAEEARSAVETARAGGSALFSALAMRLFDRCCVPYLLSAIAHRETSP